MRKIIFSLIIIFSVYSGTAYSGCVDTFGIGAKATSLGGAYSAYASDPFAVYYNPAGLTRIDSITIAAGSSLMDPELKAKGYTIEQNHTKIMGPVTFEDESDSLIVPHIGYAMPISSKFAMGIALYAPFGLHVKWDNSNDPVLNPSAYNSYESWYTRAVVNPAIAYKLNDKFSLGFGISIGQSSSGAYLNSYSLYKKGIYGSIEADLEDDLNYSFNMGFLYNFSETFTFGFTFRSKADADFTGDLVLKNLSDTEKHLLNNALSAIMGQSYADVSKGNNFKSDIELTDVDHPHQIQFGVKYSPNAKVNIVADLVWTQWSTVKNQTVIIKDKYIQALLGHDKDKFIRNWEDTRQVKIGVEYLINDMFTFRCGYFYDPSPIPDDTFDLVWPDADKKSYSIGLGVNYKNWVFDGSLQYVRSEMDRIAGGESHNLNHSYGGEPSHIAVKANAAGKIFGYALTATYKF